MIEDEFRRLEDKIDEKKEKITSLIAKNYCLKSSLKVKDKKIEYYKKRLKC